MAPDAAVNEPFALVFARPHAVGFLAGVALPPGRCAVGDDVMGRLHDDEAAYARALAGFRQNEWVGGRLAAHVAARHLGISGWSLLVGRSGEPTAPAAFSASIAHKRTLAIALVAHGANAGIGVDIEDDVAAARAIEDIVLAADERGSIRRLRAPVQERAFVVAFSLKEAVYKALSARVDHVLAYREARVDFDIAGSPSVTMRVDGTAVQPRVDLVLDRHGRHVITAVKVRP